MKYLSPLYKIENEGSYIAIKNRFTELIKYKIDIEQSSVQKLSEYLSAVEEEAFLKKGFASLEDIYMEETEFLAFSERLRLLEQKFPEITYQDITRVEKEIEETELVFYMDEKWKGLEKEKQSLLVSKRKNAEAKNKLVVIAGETEFVKKITEHVTDAWIAVLEVNKESISVGPVTCFHIYGYEPAGEYQYTSEKEEKEYQALVEEPENLQKSYRLFERELLYCFLDLATKCKHGFSNIWATRIFGNRLNKKIYVVPYRKGG